LGQIVRSCFLALHDGDLESPQASLDVLAPALHLGERLVGSSEAAEAAAWVRATARFFEIAKEALAPRLTLDTLLQRERSETEREVLQILRRAEKTALRRGEIAARWSAPHSPPTTMRIGQILAGLHESGLVVRVKQRARGGSDVAFYRLSRLGRELCEKLNLPQSVPECLVGQKAFYGSLRAAMRADTTAPLYLTTFADLDGHHSARQFHDELLASLSEIHRPIHWIFVRSTYFQETFWPRISAMQTTPLHLYLRNEPTDLEPTVQVLGDGGRFYPIVPKTALATTQDVALAAWQRHRSMSTPLN
jgi:hypothetical protein